VVVWCGDGVVMVCGGNVAVNLWWCVLCVSVWGCCGGGDVAVVVMRWWRGELSDTIRTI
jgi:hypothetical protein